MGDYSNLQQFLGALKRSKDMCSFRGTRLISRNATNLRLFWDEAGAESMGNGYSPLEGLLSLLYVVLITKEKYSGEIPVLCADMFFSSQSAHW